MKKGIFISILMALLFACSNEIDFIDESGTPTNKRSELMDSGILTIDYEAYSGSPTSNFYYAVVEVKVQMWHYSGEIFYPLNEVVTLCGRVGEPSTQLEYSFPVSAGGFTPMIRILQMLDRDGNPVNVPGSKEFWLLCSSAGEYDQVQLNVGETFSTHCLSADIGIALNE